MGSIMRVNPAHQSDINDGKILAIGYEDAADGEGLLDFAAAANTKLYGFYTMRPITIVAGVAINCELHACDTTPGVVSITDSTKDYITFTTVEGSADHAVITGVLGTDVTVPAGTMLYANVETQSADSGAAAGQAYFILEYR